MKIKNTYLSFFISFLVTAFGFSQNNPEALVKKIMTDVKSSGYSNVDKKALFANEASQKATIKALQAYSKDTLVSIQNEVYSILSQVGLKSAKGSSSKQMAIDGLIAGINTQFSESELSCINQLRKFNSTDFSLNQKEKIKQTIAINQNNIGALAKLVAFVCGSVAQQDLNRLSSKEGLSKNDKKHIKYAKVRAGDDALAQKLIDGCKQQLINDDFVYGLVPELIYTRNKKVFSYLFELVMSDEKRCTTSDNEDEKPMICGYRIIAQIAPYVSNFPVKLNSNGEVDAANPEVLLSNVRKWIQTNKTNFVLNTDIY